MQSAVSVKERLCSVLMNTDSQQGVGWRGGTCVVLYPSVGLLEGVGHRGALCYRQKERMVDLL